MEHFHGMRVFVLFFLVNVFLSATTSGSERRQQGETQRQVRVARSGGGHASGVAPGSPKNVRPRRGNYVRPVRQIGGGGNTCHCTCGGQDVAPYGGGGPGTQSRGEFDEIDNSGIPGWGPGCSYLGGNCPTNRPLKPVEETKYLHGDQFASDLEYFMSYESPGKK